MACRGARLEAMARKADLQIFWIVLLAAIFWGAIWEHEKLYQLYRKTPIPGWLRRASSNGE